MVIRSNAVACRKSSLPGWMLDSALSSFLEILGNPMIVPPSGKIGLYELARHAVQKHAVIFR